MTTDNHDKSDLLKLLDAINHKIMEQSERELSVNNTSVDFESMGEFPNRLSNIFEAFREGFGAIHDSLDLLSGTLLILPYRQGDGIEATNPMMIEWSPEKQGRWVPDINVSGDKEASELAIEKARNSANIANAEVHIFQIPYFVRPFTLRDNISFNVDDFVYHEPMLIETESEGRWIEKHSNLSYVQRFVFTFMCKGDVLRLKQILLDEGGNHINHILGAFFSWMGIAAEDRSRFQTERIASDTILRLHELGNDLKSLYVFTGKGSLIKESSGDSPTDNTLKNMKDLLDYWEPLIDKLQKDISMISQIGSTLIEKRVAFTWFAVFKYWLEKLGARQTGEPSCFEIEGSGAWHPPSHFDLSGITHEASQCQILFTKYHFDKLINNLFTNANRSWTNKKQTGTQHFKISADVQNGHMKLSFASEGSPIDSKLLPKLFRQAVPAEAQGHGGNGVALWALGMAMKTFGIPLPTVVNEKDFGPRFVFLFPRNR